MQVITKYQTAKHNTIFGLHGCKNLEELWVSDSLDHLYLHSFHGCEKLKKIHWKGKLYTIDDLIAI